MKQTRRWIALFLTALLLFSLAAPAAAAAENTVTVRTADDLLELAKKCTLDIWSQSKTVVLEADLDLQDTDFAPIPTFGGTFLGNGHRISGLRISGSGNVRGLFRYLQSGAVVQDLTVEGVIHPSGRQDDLGLLAGSNAGRLLNCTAVGTVVGDNRIGGVVGTNEEGGELIACRFSGSITGKHSAGGVAGENHGTLTRCENSGSINTKDLEDNPKTDYTDLAQLNSMENVAAYTDIGGIAGLSGGTIQSCVNGGAVGYEQIGYNIGGIAGRSSGWLDGCTNTGAVSGRKDVGGIVGQVEPEVMKLFDSDFIDRLLAQLDALQDVLDRTANHADSIADAVNAQMNDLSDKARSVKKIAGDLTDAMTDWANGNIDQINELSARISWSLDQLDDIMDDMVDMADDLDDLVDDLEQVHKDLADAMKSGDAAVANFQNALTALKSANGALKSTTQEVSRAAAVLLSAVISGADNETLLDALNDLAYAMRGFENVWDALDTSLSRVSDALDSLSGVGVNLKKALDDLEYVRHDADGVTDHLYDVSAGLQNMIHELAEKPDIKIEPIGSDITDKGDELQDAMDALLDSGDALNALISDSADTLIGDMKAVNSQFRAITALIRSEKNDWDSDRSKSLEDQIKDHFQDVSDTCDLEKQHDGRVSASENRGEVTGDSNLGGVVGSIGIEMDFNVDDDVTKVGNYSLDFHYQARALVSGCVNSGTVTGRGDNVGGIAGRAEIGRLTACQSYGGVTTDGSYVGGIAGCSDGSIDAGWAKCTLSGKDYVGGAAGYGSTLTDCRTLVSVTGEAYVGAVAGDVDDDGEVQENTFTHDSLGGLDGISYAGQAEPVSFDELCAAQGTPKLFTQLELTFRADGKVVEVVPFQYGRGIDKLPEIPAKRGCSAAWPELDYSNLTASQTLDAIYTPYSTSLTDGGDTLPQILVDGSFGSRAQITHTTENVSWVDAKGKSYSGEAVTVTLDDPDFKEVSYTVHYRLPESGKRYTLWVKTGDGWEQRESSVDGSYLLFGSSEKTVTFCVQEREEGPLLWIILAAAAVLVIILIVVLIRRKRGKLPHTYLRRLREKKRAKQKK